MTSASRPDPSRVERSAAKGALLIAASNYQKQVTDSPFAVPEELEAQLGYELWRTARTFVRLWTSTTEPPHAVASASPPPR